MSTLHVISRQQALQTLVQELGIEGVCDTTPYLDLVLPEIIRSTLYHLSLADGEGVRFRPVYTRKLTSAVRRHLEAVCPHMRQDSAEAFFSNDSSNEAEPTDQVTWHLKRLAMFGDVINLRDGFWLPCPVKLINLPDTDDVLVLGGMSTGNLKRLWSGLRAEGYGRTFTGSVTDSSGLAEHQSYDDWVEWRPGDLRDWITERITKAIKEGSPSSASFTDFEVYLSSWELRNRTAQTWLPAFGLSTVAGTEPVMLCRTRSRPYRYFLGHFSGAVLKREYTVAPEHVRWIQLGLGLYHGLSPLASWEGTSLRLFPMPPPAVERHLLAYAYPLQPQPGQFSYYVAASCRARVEHYLERVGYRNRNRGGTAE